MMMIMLVCLPIKLDYRNRILHSLPYNSFEMYHLFQKTAQQRKQDPQQVDKELDCRIQGTYKLEIIFSIVCF